MIEILVDHPSKTAVELIQIFEEHPHLTGAVNWTGGLQEVDCLNKLSRTHKLSQLIRLESCGVTVPYFTLSRPPDNVAGWLGRDAFHQQGRDLTRPMEEPDYWVSWLAIEEEWRLHFFRRRRGSLVLLRSGKKVPKREKPHPWIRANRLGWKISYVGGAPALVVAEARKAIDALQLDFGAVDVGVVMDQPVVLEVNTCPGLEGNTLEMYGEEILRRFGA